VSVTTSVVTYSPLACRFFHAARLVMIFSGLFVQILYNKLHLRRKYMCTKDILIQQDA
jgi:hypothetical protein